jgi:hypothetical protein
MHGHPVPRDGVCLICKRPLGADRHYMVKPPDGEHTRCRARVELAAEITWLRNTYGAMKLVLDETKKIGERVAPLDRDDVDETTLTKAIDDVKKLRLAAKRVFERVR